MEFRVCSASRPNRHLFCAHRRHSCTTHARDSTQRLSSTQSVEVEREKEREREKEDDAFFFFLRKKKKTTKKKKDTRFGIE